MVEPNLKDADYERQKTSLINTLPESRKAVVVGEDVKALKSIEGKDGALILQTFQMVKKLQKKLDELEGTIVPGNVQQVLEDASTFTMFLNSTYFNKENVNMRYNVEYQLNELTKNRNNFFSTVQIAEFWKTDPSTRIKDSNAYFRLHQGLDTIGAQI